MRIHVHTRHRYNTGTLTLLTPADIYVATYFFNNCKITVYSDSTAKCSALCGMLRGLQSLLAGDSSSPVRAWQHCDALRDNIEDIDQLN